MEGGITEQQREARLIARVLGGLASMASRRYDGGVNVERVTQRTRAVASWPRYFVFT